MKLPSVPTAWSPLIPLLKIVAVVALAFAAYHYIVAAPRHAAQKVQTSKAATAEANSIAGAAVDTVRTMETYHTKVERIETRTQGSNHEITSAPGAGAIIDPGVYGAIVGALCLHDDRTDDVCVGRPVLHPDDSEPVTPDPHPSRADPRPDRR